MNCVKCNGPLFADFDYCPSCGEPITEKPEQYFYEIYSKKENLKKGKLRIKSGLFKRFCLFTLVNIAIILPYLYLTNMAFIKVVPFILIYSCTIPFFTLLISRWLAKKSHDIYIIDPLQIETHEEYVLYEMIYNLSQKAGLKYIPQVGIYESTELNAFATGFSKKRSLVAFSSGLLDKMDEESIKAIMAHEIAHIANGDMVTLTLVQSIVNFLINLIMLPFVIYGWVIKYIFESKGNTKFITKTINAIQFIATVILVFMGSLIVKAFSRKREFSADRLSAELVSPIAMKNALIYLKNDIPVVLPYQKNLAMHKINSPIIFFDIFSTHPSMERRIRALEKTFSLIK